MSEAEADRAGPSGLRSGLLSNYAAFAVVALAGLGVNFVVLGASGASALGVFSQTYVVFVVAAQVATAGIHHAMLTMISHRPRADASGLLRVGLRAVAVTSVPTALATAVAAPALAAGFDSSGLGRAVAIAAIGLPFHAANKVAIAYTNALGSMHRFALFQTVRATAMLGAVVILAAADEAPWLLAAAFPISEGALSIAIAIALPRIGGPRTSSTSGRDVLAFGGRAMTGGLVQEISARVDVILLAVLVDDASVGVFTVAATMVEGCYQLLAVLRNNLNPTVAAAVARGDTGSIEAAASRLRRHVWVVAGACWLALLIAGRPFIDALGGSDDLERAFWPLVIMLAALGLAAPLLPFDQALLVGGFPAAQSALMLVTFAVNVVGNVTLVPAIGINGAAASTGVSFVVLASGTWWGVRRLMGVNLAAHPAG